MSRITMQRSCFNKMKTQLNRHKAKHADLLKMLDNAKITENPKHDSIFWNPSKELCVALADLLQNEQAFSRDPTKHTFKVAEENIARFRKYAEAI